MFAQALAASPGNALSQVSMSALFSTITTGDRSLHCQKQLQNEKMHQSILSCVLVTFTALLGVPAQLNATTTLEM
jgi:hypothetical protein